MTFKLFAAAVAATSFFAASAYAEGVMVSDGYATKAFPEAQVAAGYMTLMDHGEGTYVLLRAETDRAARVMIHQTVDAGDGVMQMQPIADGLAIPEGGMATLEPGGTHIMFMGLEGNWSEGEMIPVRLIFADGLEIETELMVKSGQDDAEAEMSHDH